MPVYQDRNKTFYVKYGDNKTKRGFKTKREAKQFLKLQAELEKEEEEIVRIKEITFLDLANEYLKDRKLNVSYSTYSKSERVVRSVILPHVPKNKHIINFTRLDCKGFRDYLQKLDYSSTQ